MALCLDNVETRSVQLERFQFIARQILPDSLIRSLTVEANLDPMMAGMVYDLRAEIYGKKFPKEVIRYPADWWQAFKDRWFPEWAKRRWPVRYTRHSWEVSHLYPELTIQGRDPVVHFAVFGPFTD